MKLRKYIDVLSQSHKMSIPIGSVTKGKGIMRM